MAFYRGAFLPTTPSDPLAAGVPTFDSKAAALQWATDLSRQPSNPAFPGLVHSVSTLIGRAQTYALLLPRITQQDVPRARPRTIGLGGNRFANTPVHALLVANLSLAHHARLSSESAINTLQYCFDHMRCGILVQIRARKVVTFAPFVNDEYRNTWAGNLTVEPSPLRAYYEEKRNYYREERIIQPVDAWWANGNIICNEMDAGGAGVQWWGDNLLLPFKNMLEAVCAGRDVPDVDFFFNKRDHPQLRRNLCEPYEFLFDRRDVPLPDSARFAMYAPFVSFYCAPAFSDLACPTNEDWKGAVGKVFPDSTIPLDKGGVPEPSDLFTQENFVKFKCAWEHKTSTAFFRGNATGGGTTPANNQRLALAQLSHMWRQQQAEPGEVARLDAGVTGFNVRDKKLFGEPMRFSRLTRSSELRAEFVPMYKQSTYKYLVYVEGHCAANRYSFLMRLGSVVLRVQSRCEASELWFFPLLKAQDTSRDVQPGMEAAVDADHVLVKPDLSDLKAQIDWCRRNDLACRQIAANALRFYEARLSRDAILDYWQLLLCEVGARTVHPPAWFASTAALRPPPVPVVHGLTANGLRYCWVPPGEDPVLCKRCRETKEEAAALKRQQPPIPAAAAAAAAGEDPPRCDTCNMTRMNCVCE